MAINGSNDVLLLLLRLLKVFFAVCLRGFYLYICTILFFVREAVVSIEGEIVKL